MSRHSRTNTQYSLSTSNLIWPSCQANATIYKKVFFPQIMSNKSCAPTKRRIIISSRTFECLYCLPPTLGDQAGHLIQGRSNKMLQRKKTTPRPNECCNIPLSFLETVLNQSWLFAEVLLIYHYIFAGKHFWCFMLHIKVWVPQIAFSMADAKSPVV